jgi:hypothetical protein
VIGADSLRDVEQFIYIIDQLDTGKVRCFDLVAFFFQNKGKRMHTLSTYISWDHFRNIEPVDTKIDEVLLLRGTHSPLTS